MPTVLIVEDDADFRRMLDLLLSAHGYDVEAASNGLQGLELMRRSRPCLILLDLMMPVLDGRGFRERQLLEPDFASIPVLCVSAAHEAERVALELRTSGCLAKPVDMDHLLNRVKEYCGDP